MLRVDYDKAGRIMYSWSLTLLHQILTLGYLCICLWSPFIRTPAMLRFHHYPPRCLCLSASPDHLLFCIAHQDPARVPNLYHSIRAEYSRSGRYFTPAPLPGIMVTAVLAQLLPLQNNPYRQQYSYLIYNSNKWFTWTLPLLLTQYMKSLLSHLLSCVSLSGAVFYLFHIWSPRTFLARSVLPISIFF